MAHPTRAVHVAEMVARLHEQGTDPDVAWDYDSRGPWWCWQRAWALRTGNHHLVLQDDVRFCADLHVAVETLVALRPSQPISLFSPRESVDVAVRRGHLWVLAQNFLYAQALVLPRDLGDRAVEWIQGHDQSRWGTHDDYRLGKAFRGLSVLTAVTVPSLVDHLDGPSLVNPEPGRVCRARNYIGDAARANLLDWSTTTHTFE